MLQRVTKLMGAGAVAFGLLLTAAGATTQLQRPNIVVFLTDDQGYGDLSSYGHPTISTPRLDRMASEGIRFTSFYAAPACTPSRAQFMTGRYPVRSGLLVPQGPNSRVGLQAEEVTLAEALRTAGYRTGMVGKWHLGDFASDAGFSPLAHGFDSFLGLPYSHDYRPPFVAGAPPVPLYRDREEVERPVVFETLTQRFTDEAVRFIREADDRPFFLFVAYAMPHLPIDTPPASRGRSRAGRYGDVIEEIDASVGRVLDTLRLAGVDDRTLTVFFSDNGPWVNAPPRSLQDTQTLWDTGSAGPLRGTKGTTWEGGIRVPGIVRWPAGIGGGRTVADPVSALDLFPTLIRAGGGTVPVDRPIDGHDLLPFLTTGVPAPERQILFFAGGTAEAIREGSWKLRLSRVTPPDGGDPTITPELFDLDRDPFERRNVAADYPDVAGRLRAAIESFRSTSGRFTPTGPPANQLPQASGRRR